MKYKIFDINHNEYLDLTKYCVNGYGDVMTTQGLVFFNQLDFRIETEDYTGHDDINGEKIYKDSPIKTQIDGLLPKWYKGRVTNIHGCYGLEIEKGHFEPMCWFENTEVITEEELID